MPISPVDEPLRVAAEDGMVLIDGQDGIAITMTAEAAIATGYRLNEIALLAVGQRRVSGWGTERPLRCDVEACATKPMPISQEAAPYSTPETKHIGD